MKLSKLNAATSAAASPRQASAARGLAVRADVKAGAVEGYMLFGANSRKYVP